MNEGFEAQYCTIFLKDKYNAIYLGKTAWKLIPNFNFQTFSIQFFKCGHTNKKCSSTNLVYKIDDPSLLRI